MVAVSPSCRRTWHGLVVGRGGVLSVSATGLLSVVVARVLARILTRVLDEIVAGILRVDGDGGRALSLSLCFVVGVVFFLRPVVGCRVFASSTAHSDTKSIAGRRNGGKQHEARSSHNHTSLSRMQGLHVAAPHMRSLGTGK